MSGRVVNGTGRSRGTRRDELVAGIAAYLLDNGLTGLSLRPLARALHTSDRMLLYYFGTREALVASSLEHVADGLHTAFAAALPDRLVTPTEAIAAATSRVADHDTAAALRLWLEVVTLAARGDRDCQQTAAKVLSGWVSWLSERLDVPDSDRLPTAAALLAVIDGLVLIRLAGSTGTADTAMAWLAARLDQ